VRVIVKLFRGTFITWDALFAQAADFASHLPPERVISIAHSSDGGEGLVAVWYWGDPETCPRCGYSLLGNVSGRCPECGAPA
jgi:hypothetical protein